MPGVMYSEALLHLRRAFPLNWSMVRKCRLPIGRIDEPYFVRFEPGGGIFGERWNQFDPSGVLHKGAYHPVSIAQYALHSYERFSEGDTAARETFLRQAEYLRGAQQPDGTYPYPLPHPGYDVPAGWISGLAQAETFSVFLRAYAITNNAEYLDRARASLGAFERTTDAGGVTFIRGNDVFFEEMPARATHILNGHLLCAFSVWEAGRYGLASARVTELHEAAIETLIRWLPLYDDDGWSYYELAVQGEGKRHYVPITYHQLHVNLLRIYGAMTSRREFDDLSASWRRGLDRWDVRARVWRDSLEWIAESGMRRLRRAPAGAWRSLAPDGPAHSLAH